MARGARSLTALLALAGAAACGGDERTTVRFWAFGREGEMVRRLVPEFERRHPGIAVQVEAVPWTAAHEKLLTAHVGEATPDAAQLGNTWIPEFVALRALAPLIGSSIGTPPSPLTPLPPSRGERGTPAQTLRSPRSILEEGSTLARTFREDSFPGVWETNVVDGVTWGLPWYVDTRVLFYRTDLLAAAGAPWPPRTWAEWRAAMVAVKALGPDRYAILLPIDEWDKPVILGLQAGAPLLADGGRRGAFRDPRFRRAMAFYLDLYDSGLAPPLDLTGVANLYQQLAEGYFAMVVTGPWNLGEFRRRLPPELQDRWATAPLPAPDESFGYPGLSLAGGSSLVLFRAARQPEAAWAWIEYLAEAEQQARFYELTGDLPARPSAWTGQLAADPRAAAFRVQLERVAAMPKVPEWEQIATKVAERAEQVMRGARDLDAALAGLDADVDRILARRRWLLDRAAAEAPE